MIKKKILMVCLGNICRSPLAQGILAEKCKKLKVFIDSAGTSSYHIGQEPDLRAQMTAKDYHINISNQKARVLTTDDIKTFDHIYVMDKSNYSNTLKLVKNKEDEQKIDMILNAVHPGRNLDVPDPYFGGEDSFKEVYSLLNEACEKIKKQLEKIQDIER